MYVVTKKAFLFQKDKIEDDPATRQRVQIVEEEFKLYPNQNYTPQEIPDWVKSTELYKLAKKDGGIMETVEAPETDEEKEAEEHRKHPAGPRGATGLQQGQPGWNKK
jgi:hypothetical protein